MTLTLALTQVTAPQPVRATGAPRFPNIDFDGDGRADWAGLFYEWIDGSTMCRWLWTTRNSQGTSSIGWGFAGDCIDQGGGDWPVPGDYDGDGKTDVAVFRKSNGEGVFYVRRSSDGSLLVQQWGGTYSYAVPADYDGDGTTDFAVYETPQVQGQQATWHVLRSSDGTTVSQPWGGHSSDWPARGDFDGDGRADFAVKREPSPFARAPTSIYYILQSTAGFLALPWGREFNTNVPGDYDGDGKSDVAVSTSSPQHIFYIRRSSDGSYFAVQWGPGYSRNAPGDYDGDGKTDIAVYDQGVFYVYRSSDGGVMREVVAYGGGGCCWNYATASLLWF